MPTAPASRTPDIDISFKPRVAIRSNIIPCPGGVRGHTGQALGRVRKASPQAIKQDSPPLYGGEHEHPRLDPGVIREPLPDDVLIRRVDDDQDLALTLERSAEHDEPRVDKTVHERA